MNLDPNTFQIGIIGMGDMGRLYARYLYQAGWIRLNVCDLPDKTLSLKQEFPHYNVLDNGQLVSRISDLIIYSVEAKYINQVVKVNGPSTKVGAIVTGQTSVKAPEVNAFETYLPQDVHIIPIHSMHGPTVSPKGQPLIIINHRATETAMDIIVNVLSCLNSKLVFLSAMEHDKITADTQAVTHLAFKSMGTAWMNRTSYPWEDSTYAGGVDNIKIAMMLRIYSNNWHVYAGLGLLNPAAQVQISQYAKSVESLFSLMIQERTIEFNNRVRTAAQYVFGTTSSMDLLLADRLLDQYTLSESINDTNTDNNNNNNNNNNTASTKHKKCPNSHLSLLAMVDCWHILQINPYKHLIVQTPPFRLWLGIVEYVIKSPGLLDKAIEAALFCKELRADDLAFVIATSQWAQIILQGHFDSYQTRFEHTQTYFINRLEDGRRMSAKIIETVTANIKANINN